MTKFGVEIELNSFDQRDFKKNPLLKDEWPLGIIEINNILNSLGFESTLEKWHQTHNNSKWVCKPDSSCGIEICSPVMESSSKLLDLIDFLSKNEKIKLDDRCSFHVHIDVSDIDSSELLKILSWWIKFEHLFFDIIPKSRKLNKYCQCIGILDLFEHNEKPNLSNIISKLGQNKYFSLNCYHLYKGNRPSIEFRTAGSEACLDKSYTENWINLLLYFIEVSKKLPEPEDFCWVGLEDFLDIMKFENKLKFWFLENMSKNIISDIIYWDYNFRKKSLSDLNKVLLELQLDKQLKVNCF